MLVTLDKDFTDVRAYPPAEHAGMIVLRPRDQRVASLTEVVRRLLPVLDAEPVAGHLWVVDERRVRIRR